MQSLLLLPLLFTFFLFLTRAEIRFSEIRSDSRSTIPFDEFGFTHSGYLNLTVTDVSISVPAARPDLSLVGFFLCTRDSWLHVLEQLREGEIQCSLQSSSIKPVFNFNQLEKPNSIYPTLHMNTSVNVSESNLLVLVLANCVPNSKISMNVHSVMYNYNPKTRTIDFLSAGKTSLPSIYFMFFLVYLSLGSVWIYTLYKKRLSVHRIHSFMLAVLTLKALNLLFEAEDKSHIKRTGSAHGWDVLFYIFSFMKGITLFSLIVLIGTGWSFLKPYLQDKEKKVLIVVIPLQVVSNVAQVVIDESGPSGENLYTWKQVFLIVDIICCGAVLFPIVWSIRNLREAATTDGKAAVNLMKLTLFKQYYVVVICYIYFTRVVVYSLESITSYEYEWSGVVACELATLGFYVFTGYNFRPKMHNPYLVVEDEEEEAASEALKLDDEFDL